MLFKRVLLAVVISCLLTSAISKQTATIEPPFEPQCITITASIAKIEYFVMLITRHFLILWTIYHIHRAAAPYFGRRRVRL